MMNLNDGATHEIVSRWPVHKQRNVGISYTWYGQLFADNMTIGIELVRSHHNALKLAGETIWSIPTDLSNILDELCSVDN